MKKFYVIFSILLTVQFIYGISEIPVAEDDDTYIFLAKQFPRNRNYLPTLGNGHVGFTLSSNDIYMNGLYNGHTLHSHRARIPNWANIRVDYCQGDKKNDCEWSLNVKDGIFKETIRSQDFELQHLIYPHRVSNRAIVNQINITRLNNNADLTLKIYQEPGVISREKSWKLWKSRKIDIDFNETKDINIKDYNVHTICGHTLEVEHEKYQPETKQVCIMWNNVPEVVTMHANEMSQTLKYIVTIDEQYEVAENEMENLLSMSDEMVLKTHTDAWNKFWNEEFNIHIKGDNNLAAVVHASIFYMTTTLPSLKTVQPPTRFYGLSPNGVGRGGNREPYLGHNFWDTEFWMFHSVNMMSSEWARQLLSYRYSVMEAAKDFAIETGYKGARFPWESSYTGVETTPEPIYANEIHLIADISYAMRLYLQTTHDYEWFRNEGCEMSREIARFWASRVEWDEETGTYNINDVIGPDEDNKGINNNVFTNVVAIYALQFGVFTECLCNKIDPDYKFNQTELDNWQTIGDKVKVLYDPELDYHPQFEGYKIGTKIKQADVVLLGYPLEYPHMNESTRLNDLEIYEKATRLNGPGYTWANHVINHLELGHYDHATLLFNRTYQEYVSEPFNVWFEGAKRRGAVNFITGAGGLIQVILNGYLGIRPRMDHLEIRQSEEMPGVSEYTVHGMNYLGSSFSIYKDSKTGFIQFDTINPTVELKITHKGVEETVCKGCRYFINKDGVILRASDTKLINSCHLPSN